MKLLFMDIETSTKKINNISSIGAVNENGTEVFNKSYNGRLQSTYDNYIQEFNETAHDYDCLVGHNILNHDLEFLYKERLIDIELFEKKNIDTLRLSSLIFIKKPYHKLIKDYKIDKTNNPVEDSRLCKEVFENCIKKFSQINEKIQRILYSLLKTDYRFKTFFEYYIGLDNELLAYNDDELVENINGIFDGLLEKDFKLDDFIKNKPLEFAYVFRLLAIKQIPDKDDGTKKKDELDREFSVLPKWIILNLPYTSKIIKEILKHKHYDLGGDESKTGKEAEKGELWRFFHYKYFRKYPTEYENVFISQKEIIEQTLKGENILAILATGGGKSLTFQLPALINSDKIGCLSIVISPLQSLMKDQVDTLNDKDIQNVGYLNGLLNPLERREVIDKIEYGGIDILYMSPEMLRSKNIIKILSGRIIDRIIIDEAHCFSKWGHDFRTDYMFIADFIKALAIENPSVYDRDTNQLSVKISCFTATAKKDVTDEIKQYFKDNLGIDLKVFLSTVDRKNLHYRTIEVKDNQDKLNQLVGFIKDNILDQNDVSEKDGNSCIIFVRTTDGAEKLSKEINSTIGSDISAFYHGKLPSEDKRSIQNDFKDGIKRIIVATNAFGMGIDKDNVEFVIHYDIPASIENYVQEAGRAGRNEELVPNAQCIIYYCEEDVDKNLEMQKQSKLKYEQITSLLKTLRIALKQSKGSKGIQMSEKELIIRSWLGGDRTKWQDPSNLDDANDKKKAWNQQTKRKNNLKQAIYHLEKLGFIKRGFNVTRVYATSKGTENPTEANSIIEGIPEFKRYGDNFVKKVKEIHHSIQTGRVISIEDIPDEIPGLTTKKVELIVKTLYKYKLIDYKNDISIIINPKELEKKFKDEASLMQFDLIDQVLNTVVDYITDGLTDTDTNREIYLNRAEMITKISKRLHKPSLKTEVTEVLNFLKNLKNNGSSDDEEDDGTKGRFMVLRHDKMMFYSTPNALRRRVKYLLGLSKNVLDYCINQASSKEQKSNTAIFHEVSLPEVLNHVNITERFGKSPLNIKAIEEAFRFLHNLGIIKVESGLFMFWTQFILNKGDKPLSEEFRKKDFEDLKRYYKEKTRQIHFMQECAILFENSESAGKEFIKQYFVLNHDNFVKKYFSGREDELDRLISAGTYNRLFGKLDAYQNKVIENKGNSLVLAGPGAGKTTTLVHKVASLVLNEDINNEEFLLLSFTRAAMIELKQRVKKLVPGWYNLDIHTFHGFAYKVLGKVYDKDDGESNDKIIIEATRYLLENNEELPYSVIILDEFQDISDIQYNFVKAIKKCSSQYIIRDDTGETIKNKEVRMIAAGDDDQAIFGNFGGNIKYIKQFKEDYNAEQIILPVNYRSNQKIIDFTQAFIRNNKGRIPEKNGTKFVSYDGENIFANNAIVRGVDCSDPNYIGHIPYYVNLILNNSHIENHHIGILCHTNEEVMNVAHILKKSGYENTSILLSDAGYKIANALEFYEFIESFRNWDNGQITNADIDEKIKYVEGLFGDADKNRNVRKLLIAIEGYRNLYSFYNRNNLRDYFHDIDENDVNIDNGGTKITISTMHKSKGLEFDSVISVFDTTNNEIIRDTSINSEDSIRRLLYVSFTRPRHNLIILGNHSNKYFQEILDVLESMEAKWEFENNSLIEMNNNEVEDSTKRMALVTTLGDINLGFNKRKYFRGQRNYLPLWTKVELRKNQRGNLGDICYKGGYLHSLSQDFRGKLEGYMNKGYEIKNIQIYQRVVYYYDESKRKNSTSDEKYNIRVYLFVFSLVKS